MSELHNPRGVSLLDDSSLLSLLRCKSFKLLLMISSSGNAKDAPSFTDGLHPTHRPSSRLPVNSLSGSPLSVSSGTVLIPSKPSYTSTSIPPSSPEPGVISNKTGLTRSATELLGDPASERRTPSRPNKRKRDSELRGMSGSHLRDAQEKVEKKRAKIAARVPSAMAAGNATPTSTPITSLADLYTQLRRDSSISGQKNVLDVLPTPKITPKAVSGNGRHQDHQLQGTPRGHSSGSSPDPIAMSENDQEIVVVKHVRPSSPQVRTHLGSTTRVGLPSRLKALSKAKSSTLTPNASTAKQAGNSPNKLHKSKPAFAIVIPSPPKRPTQKPVSVEKHTPPGPDVPQSLDPAPADTPVTLHADTLREITNGKASKPLALHTPSPAPAPTLQAVGAITDSVPEPGLRRSRRALGPHVDSSLSPRDIDVLLGATPLPFDFSLSHIHRTSCDKAGKDDSGGEGSSLWWYHPIFEARAKADIRRTLSALLPADPARDPPLPIGRGTVGWRAEVRPRQSRARMWADRLEDAFGPGPLERGLGRKPRRVAVSPSLLPEFILARW